MDFQDRNNARNVTVHTFIELKKIEDIHVKKEVHHGRTELWIWNREAFSFALNVGIRGFINPESLAEKKNVLNVE